MDFSKLKKATDPVFEELYENLFSGEEKAASQGAGASLTETGEPCVCLFFRKNDPKGVFWVQKWNNASVLGVLIQAEVRAPAVLC